LKGKNRGRGADRKGIGGRGKRQLDEESVTGAENLKTSGKDLCACIQASKKAVKEGL